jgi:hypothetical protein
MFRTRKVDQYVYNYSYSLDDLSQNYQQVSVLADQTRQKMNQVSEHFAHLKEMRNRNTDPWFHPTSIADAFSNKLNETEEATKLYNTHTGHL